MHTTPWYWATELPNVSPKNLVQVGIGGWQVPRAGVQEARERQTNVLTIEDVERLGLEKTAEIALELAWDGIDAVYISFDVDSVDCGFVPGTGWPEPGGFLPREALKLVGLVAKEGMCGLEVVEVSPPYDTSDITALLGVRVVVEVLGAMVANGKLGSHKASSTSRSALMHDDPTIAPRAPDHLTAPATTAAAPRGAMAGAASRPTVTAEPTPEQPEPDFDLVEAAFVEGFASARTRPASCAWPACRCRGWTRPAAACASCGWSSTR